MKLLQKIISLSLIAALCLPALVSCGPKDDTPGGVDGAATGDSYAPEKEGLVGTLAKFASYPDGNYLADAKFDTDDYLPDFDKNPDFDASSLVASNGDTVFFCGTREDGSQCIMFVDKKSGAVAPLCGKPECLHNDENCSAYVCRSSEALLRALSFYDGMLYWLQQDGAKLRLCRQKEDGTAREIVSELSGSAFGSSSVFLHRGYAYVMNITNKVVDGITLSSSTLRAIPLDGGEAVKIADSDASMYVEPLGNGIYIMLYECVGQNLGEMNTGKQTLELYRWDMKTRVAELLAVDKHTDDDGTEEKNPEELSLSPCGITSVPGDGIYFQSQTAYKVEGGRWSNSVTIRKYSFETEKIEDVIPALTAGSYDYFAEMTFASGRFAGTGADRKNGGVLDFVFAPDGSVIAEHDVASAFRYVDKNSMALMNIDLFVGADGDFAYYSCQTSVEEKTHESFFLAIPLSASSSEEWIRVDYIEYLK